jgi:hypothetical protein
LRTKNNSKVDVTLSTSHFVLRAILIETGHVFSIVFKIHAFCRRIVINKLLVIFWSRYRRQLIIEAMGTEEAKLRGVSGEPGLTAWSAGLTASGGLTVSSGGLTASA